MDEGAVVSSFLDPDVDAAAHCSGHGCLVGDRGDDRVNAGGHSRLHLVCRAPVSLRRLDVRAAAWSGTTAETCTDGLLISAERSKEKKWSADKRRDEQEIDMPQRLARRTTDACLGTA